MSVILKDLNDFIEPATECIKGATPATSTQDSNVYKADEKISITLNDCLACSGCITTSETLLISQQTAQEFLDHSLKPNSHLVVTLSPQSLCAVALYFTLTLDEATKMLVTFLRDQCNVKAIFDSSLGRSISLHHGALEFIAAQNLPLISSVCPGWICYAEKSQPSLIPHLSRCKSPQQINGYLVKHVYAAWAAIKAPHTIFHTSIMPCADKKLEASRPAFAHNGVKEVDCVLTTKEIILLLEKFEWHLKEANWRSASEAQLNSFCGAKYPRLSSHFGSGSGGYLENILIAFVKDKYPQIALSPSTFAQLITVQKVKGNADFVEYALSDPQEPSKTLIKFASVYGFRNIQNITRQIKAKKCQYAYIEIMACPSGCLNGGGQVLKEGNRIEQLVELYKSIPISREPLEVETAIPVYTEFEALASERPSIKW